MLLRTVIISTFIFCFGCGGGSETPTPTLNSKKIANGFYLEKNNSNNAIIVSDSIAIAYARLDNITTLSKVISISSDSKTNGLHLDKIQNKWISVTGAFNGTEYQYQCENVQDAGNICINALKKINYTQDQSRTAQRPTNLALNKTYNINNKILEFNGNSEQFTLNFDNGSYLSRAFTSQVTNWGSYHLISDTSTDRAIITFYTLANQSYFDLLIYTENDNYNLAGIKI